jgi:putative hemolysin
MIGAPLIPYAVGGLALLGIASAFVSAVETAFFSLTPTQLDSLKSRHASSAGGLERLLENPRRLLSAILLADALVNAPLMLGCIAVLDSQHVIEVPFWASALIVFALIVFACDLVPKLIALSVPLAVARLGVPVFRVLLPLLDPIASLLQRGGEATAEAILPAGLKKQRHLSEEELETLVELSAETGALHETESEMISEIIKLGDKTAKDCMTPRVEMFALPDDLTNDAAIVQLRQRRFRRVLVFGETPDDIEGVLDVGAFLRDPSEHYTERLDLPSFVPETMAAVTLLKNFLSHSQALAIVVDEHGGVEGVITLADLVEEIISDAVPHADARLYLDNIGDGRLLANGNARLDDIAEELGVPLDGEGIDTIGGLIFNQLGQLPKAGQQIRIGVLQVTARRVSRKRVEEVLIERVQDGEVAG